MPHIVRCHKQVPNAIAHSRFHIPATRQLPVPPCSATPRALSRSPKPQAEFHCLQLHCLQLHDTSAQRIQQWAPSSTPISPDLTHTDLT
mmetsp:Transcript_14533/g.32619  ORF Transcript_14533/g.32619 Transcript_14533/m.32619 type:complete len:89 (+) Transcript_14533:302-568(+)